MDYAPFHTPLLNLPSPNQLILDKYLQISISCDPQDFYHIKISKQ